MDQAFYEEYFKDEDTVQERQAAKSKRMGGCAAACFLRLPVVLRLLENAKEQGVRSNKAAKKLKEKKAGAS